LLKTTKFLPAKVRHLHVGDNLPVFPYVSTHSKEEFSKKSYPLLLPLERMWKY